MPKRMMIGEYPDPPVGQLKPDLPRCLFWDEPFDKIDWQRASRSVIERVLDRGTDEEVTELIRYYGRRKVLYLLKKGPIFLMDHSVERACEYFKLKPEDLRCYREHQMRGKHWPPVYDPQKPLRN